jgi:signal transduction histidine kinase
MTSVSDDQRLAAAVRLVLIGLLAAFLITGAFTRSPHNLLLSVIGIVVALPAAAAMIPSRPRQAVLLAIVSGVGVVLVSGGSHGDLGYFGLCALTLLVVITAGPRLGAVGALAALAVVLDRLAAANFSTGWFPWIGGVIVSALGAGVIVHEQRMLAQLREAQVDLAERSRLQERARIARDVHDVIAHSLTVSLLHISAARLAVEHDPEDAARALAEAERLGRESLDEVRSIVGLMRTERGEGDGGSLAPAPGIDHLQELVDRFRSAGVAISFEHDGIPAAVPRTIGTTACRIAQEALTNAAKHAPGAAVAVRLQKHDQILELTVESHGTPGRGEGHGLSSMLERAQSVGGTLEAAPAELQGGLGWRVTAQLPTDWGWSQP